MKKTGFIAIVGRPNVGKSTLLNAILGEKVAIVSSKPQTTRNRIIGIHTTGENQFVFLDTPGMHSPKNKLGDYMMGAANSSMRDSDAVILVVEAGKPVTNVEENVISYIKSTDSPSIIAINKIDLSDPGTVADTIKTYASLHDFNAFVPMSAKKGNGVSAILSECEKFLGETDAFFFPDDIATDQPERVLASEIIREKILRTLNKEVPHGTAVVIEEFKEEGKLIRIRAEIFCEKTSHKGIIVGKNGESLKLIGTRARQDLERILGTKVYLNLWVKVKENWRDSVAAVNNFGYRPGDDQ
ncbi:MAG: GTPase Era [Clostridia bacterium]|nr:GTPase Era [Clostridia bacterium]